MSSHSAMANPPPVLRISVCTDYPFLLSPQQYVQYKAAWKVQYQVFPLFHYPNEDWRQPVTAYSDRLLTNSDWVQTFIGKVFDPFEDIPKNTTDPYETTLMEQLSWASHLGLKTVMIPFVFLEKLSTANLTRCIMHHIQRTAFLQTILISLPVLLPASSGLRSSSHTRDIDAWQIWHQIQRCSDYHPQIALHLILPENSIECLLPAHVQRWISEPVRFISLETASFQANDAGFPVLPRVWQSIVKTFVSYNVGVVLQGEAQIVIPSASTRNVHLHMEDELDGDDLDTRSDGDYAKLGNNRSTPHDRESHDRLASLEFYVQYIRHLQGNVDQHLDHVARYSYAYWDTLQTPLQPLMNHLESQTYEVFEQDPIKYRSYQKAIGKALQDLTRKLFQLSPTHQEEETADIGDTPPTPPSSAGPPGLTAAVSSSAQQDTPTANKRLRPNPTDTTATLTSPSCPTLSRKLIVMVVGAGRGPLVSAALSAASEVNIPIFVYAIEKNPNAIITLKHRFQQERWQGQVELVAGDMRYWNPPTTTVSHTGGGDTPEAFRADLIVSELLGSFGDNELSPECLDAAIARFLHPSHGISIPQSYWSFLQPIAAPLQWMAARDIFSRAQGQGTSGYFQQQFGGTRNVGLETPYVVYLRRYLPLCSPMPMWEFEHPAAHNFEPISSDTKGNHIKNAMNKRHVRRTFTVDRTGCMYGFAGYFSCDLYCVEPQTDATTKKTKKTKKEEKVTLSIVPATHSEGMFSWFPMYFPLSEPLAVKEGEMVTVDMWRCVDEHRVWYEWCVVSPAMTAVHNVLGRSSCVGL